MGFKVSLNLAQSQLIMKFLVLFACVAAASAQLVTYPNGAVAPAKTPEVQAAEAAHFAAKGAYAYAPGFYGYNGLYNGYYNGYYPNVYGAYHHGGLVAYANGAVAPVDTPRSKLPRLPTSPPTVSPPPLPPLPPWPTLPDTPTVLPVSLPTPMVPLSPLSPLMLLPPVPNIWLPMLPHKNQVVM